MRDTYRRLQGTEHFLGFHGEICGTRVYKLPYKKGFVSSTILGDCYTVKILQAPGLDTFR